MKKHNDTKKRSLRWLRLDNAAKIYPAALSDRWSSVYRLSVTLKEEIDRDVLQKALDITVRRFPSIATRLQKGLFWYYLEELEKAPSVSKEYCCPLRRMSRKEVSQCALRVIVYKNRIALELFHALTDGSGALIFLKSLTAEYLEQKHNIRIPFTEGVLDRREKPKKEELKDSFPQYAGPVSASRRERAAWPMRGQPEPDGFVHVTCLRLPVKAVLEQAHAHRVTATAFLCAVMLRALALLQEQQVPNPKRRKPIKIQVPVNLRALFPSETLRNFSLYTNPELRPNLGSYGFQEICDLVKHHMGLFITPKQMSCVIAANVGSEQITAVRLMPLFIKNAVMRVFFHTGEKKACLSVSNLGVVKLPEEMVPYVDRFDFIPGVQCSSPYNSGVISYGDTLTVNFIRNTQQPDLERCFCRVLQELGLTPEVQSNTRPD